MFSFSLHHTNRIYACIRLSILRAGQIEYLVLSNLPRKSVSLLRKGKHTPSKQGTGFRWKRNFWRKRRDRSENFSEKQPYLYFISSACGQNRKFQ